MEFAEWVVSGLDQLRLGQLPGGDALYQAVSAGLGDSAVLDTYMSSGDPAAREQLIQALTQALAADPGFEQQVRQAAESAQSSSGAGAPAGPADPPFLKTTNGMLVLVAAAVVLVGGGLGLAVGLSGDSDSGLKGMMKGTWKCQSAEGGGSLTVGDDTWSVGSDKGMWKQNGNKVTVSNSAQRGTDVLLTGVPSGPGSFDVGIASPTAPTEVAAHFKGTVSSHKLTVTLEAPGQSPETMTCTK